MAFPWRAARQTLRIGLVWPFLGACALLTLASLLPVRLDERNFQDLRRAASLPVPRGVPYLFVSADDAGPAYRFAGYALHNLAYPRHEALWLHLAGGANPGRGLLLDEQGRLWRSGGGHEVDARTLAPYASGVVLYDAASTRAEAQRRLPALRNVAHVDVLAPPGPSFVRRAWRSEWSLTRLARLTALLGVAACVGHALSLWTGTAATAWAATPLATLAVLLVGLSVSQLLPVRAPGHLPFALWLAGLTTLTLLQRRMRGPSAPWRLGRLSLASAACALAFGAALFVARLDFDEDAHSHWLLQARSYYDLGRHVPEALRDGHVHAATYPFGYSQVLGLAAWAAALDTSRFLWLDLDTSLALLFYRLGVAALAMGTLALLGTHLARRAPGLGLSWAGLALVLAFFPTFQGRHLAAETVLLPCLSGALLLLASGEPALVALGLFAGGAATLLKLEGGLLFAVVVLPWAVARAPLRRGALLALLIGCLPTLVWRAALQVANPVYLTPTPDVLRSALPLLPSVAWQCLQVMLRENLLWPLALALPLAVVWRLARRPATLPAWRLLSVPLASVASVALLASIYLFTTLPRAWQIEVSFARLLLLPLFSALVYALESLTPERTP